MMVAGAIIIGLGVLVGLGFGVYYLIKSFS